MTDPFPPIGIAGIASHAPDGILTAAEISELSGIPAEILTERFGLTSKHVAGDDEHVCDMAVAAAERLLARDGIDPTGLDAVVYFGSFWKEYEVWSASPHVADRLGARNAFALELINVSCGGPVALKVVRDMMRSDERLRRVLMVAASKEGSLLDYTNERSRFMFNFGDGGCAVLLERGLDRNVLLESSLHTDGRFSLDVRVPGGGSVHPASHETVDHRMHYLDVRDPMEMKELLDPITLPNFLRVATDAIERSGYTVADLDFLVPIHFKRSLHDAILKELGLVEDQAVYLDQWGHVSAVDPFVGLEIAEAEGRLQDGDLVCALAAGTGYTWAATCIRWGT